MGGITVYTLPPLGNILLFVGHCAGWNVEGVSGLSETRLGGSGGCCGLEVVCSPTSQPAYPVACI